MIDTDIQSANLVRIPISTLKLGAPLPFTLVRSDGCILLPEGHVLRPKDVSQLHQHEALGIFKQLPNASSNTPRKRKRRGGSTNVQTADWLKEIDVANLVPGKPLERSIYDASGTLLLPAGWSITARFIQTLTKRGVYTVSECTRPAMEKPVVPANQLLLPRTAKNLEQQAQVIASLPLPAKRKGNPAATLSIPAFRAEVEQGTEQYLSSIERMPQITFDLLRSKGRALNAALDMVNGFAQLASRDAGLLPSIIAAGRHESDFLYSQSVNASLLAVCAAQRMRLPREQIIYAGLGALLQDVGMMHVPEELRLAPRALTPAERDEVERHPLYAVSLLERLENMNETTLLIAYQSHERPDGSGYPRHESCERTHPLARVVAVASSYAAMTEPRPHRAARRPYDAMVNLIREAYRNRLDREAVRLFLDSMSLFPIGSCVRLNSGGRAKVVRANPDRHTYPHIVMLDAIGNPTDVEINLAAQSELEIIDILDDAKPESPLLLFDDVAA